MSAPASTEEMSMKASSLPAVLVVTLLASAGAACGSSAARSDDTIPTGQAAPNDDAIPTIQAIPAEESPDRRTETRTKPVFESLNHPVAARPGSGSYGASPIDGGVPVAEGVNVAHVAAVLREKRERQKPPIEGRAEADRANAALDSSSAASELEALRALEDAIVDELNRLRSNPPAYAEDLAGFGKLYRGDTVTVPGYMAVRTREGTAAVDDAIAVITSIEPMPPVTRSPGLSRAARAYAYRLGHDGVLSHGGDSASPHDRMALYGRVRGMFAENVGAVYREARLMVLEQFVDDGVESRVHRYNMIGPMFRVVGVGCSPHPRYDVVCVMDFVEAYHEARD
jgi:uncharacterized protein YkwD